MGKASGGCTIMMAAVWDVFVLVMIYLWKVLAFVFVIKGICWLRSKIVDSLR